MIHEWHRKDSAPLLQLWLESTAFAHPFIRESYWRESIPMVRDIYLANATTWVWEDNAGLQGFVSVMDARFVGALFIRPAAIGRGIGRGLLEHVMQRHPQLSLEVYQKNTRAVHFYHACGFRIEDCAWQDETQHPTWIMSWQADQTP
ncbi:N-acetyltransferase [Pseudescherichia sp.]|uniref:N-acetyltransferase n=1 Tax=Pseudescherichia sp. TaxID=2055881 RepID=UPI000E9F2E03|nr:N-acetyltransferase [Pseudescherichia sp.]HAZ76807.1 N-acetyltransferase [Enterobacteriaceae bacterium]